jgi:hypothetical protein
MNNPFLILCRLLFASMMQDAETAEEKSFLQAVRQALAAIIPAFAVSRQVPPTLSQKLQKAPIICHELFHDMN